MEIGADEYDTQSKFPLCLCLLQQLGGLNEINVKSYTVGGGRVVSYHDGFERCRLHRLLVVDFVHNWSPDVQVETVLADRVLGVPHVSADKVSVCRVGWLHASVANVVRFVRVCRTQRRYIHNGSHISNSLTAHYIICQMSNLLIIKGSLLS